MLKGVALADKRTVGQAEIGADADLLGPTHAAAGAAEQGSGTDRKLRLDARQDLRPGHLAGDAALADQQLVVVGRGRGGRELDRLSA